MNSIKKPKTHRYPSLKGVDPKFRRNHRHALHGTMKALVRVLNHIESHQKYTNDHKEGSEGGQAGGGINEFYTNSSISRSSF